MKYIKEVQGFPHIENFNMDVSSMPILSSSKIEIEKIDKSLIIQKLLEAHNLAYANVSAGNITKRGFATNICTYNNDWSLGTNFNNTRNDISSVCGERSAILCAYNNALIGYLKQGFSKPFEFKIKYLCMGTSIKLDETDKFIVPCEDCLSWLNTNRYFDDETLIFGFEKFENKLSLRVTKLINLLPKKYLKTTTDEIENKKITFSARAKESLEKFNLKEKNVFNLLKLAKEKFESNNFATVSNQNTSCAILSNNEIFTSFKIDWTKRWYIEPLELCTAKAIEKQGNDTFIKAIAYFGIEDSLTNPKISDGVVSIKSLGRIRRKYASGNTLLILNTKEEIKILTISDYLPEKFIQGYKI